MTQAQNAHVSVSEARQIGKRIGVKRLAVVAVYDDGSHAVTTYGRTKADCDALKEWSESEGGYVVDDMRGA